MSQYWQRFVQILFLVLFVVLIATGRVQLWMGIFAAGILAAFLAGRVFCGWICPINTGMLAIQWVKRKLHLKNFKMPDFLTRPWIRYASLGLFLAVFLFSMISGKKLPVLPALFLIGIGLTLFFPEKMWHRHLCPFGTILSLPARFSRYRFSIAANQCINCGICEKVCPSGAVQRVENQFQIVPEECLVCLSCTRHCRHEAIHYH